MITRYEIVIVHDFNACRSDVLYIHADFRTHCKLIEATLSPN